MVSKATRARIRRGLKAWHRKRKEELLNKGGSVPVLAEPKPTVPDTGRKDGEARESKSMVPDDRVAHDDTALSGGESDSRGGSFLVHVVKVPFNPRMVLAEDAEGNSYEVIVGDNKKVWLGCPLLVRQSSEYAGYFEVEGELPRGRWDRSYLERFQASSETKEPYSWIDNPPPSPRL